MAKKPKDPLKKSNSTTASEVSNASTVFKTLFGEIPEQNSSETQSALFSENNPFRRKPRETPPPKQLGAEVSAKDAANEGSIGHSDSAELKEQRKRKKDKVQNGSNDLDAEIVEVGKKLKRADSYRKDSKDGGNLSTEAKEETLEKDHTQFQENSIGADVGGTNENKGKKKRKREEVEAEYEAKKYGVGKEEENKEVIVPVLGQKRKQIDNPEDMMISKEGFDDESKLLRTVFVGNLPLKIKKKHLLKEFGKFGEVESVRIRSIPVEDGKMPRKGAIIKKRINENGDSVHAYIVFKTEESAQASLAYNMTVLGENHIRVDRACPPRKKLKGDTSSLYDNKRTVFVGNLPFDVKDEEIYQLFSGLKNFETSVEAVRVVRDPGSSLGKGIAYVLFKTKEAAKSIVTKRNLRLRNRELRLSHAKSDSTPSKRKNASTPETNKYPAKRLAVDSRTPGSGNKTMTKSNLSYQGLRASKSGSQKKAHTTSSTPAKSKSQHAIEQSSGKKKRPAVAARKEKARQAANGSNTGGTKRKLGNRTPQSVGQKKKAKRF